MRAWFATVTSPYCRAIQHDRSIWLSMAIRQLRLTEVEEICQTGAETGKAPSDGAGRSVGGLAFGVVSLSGALGGELVYTFGIGVTYLLYPKPPDTFVDVLASGQLVEGTPHVVEDGRVPVLLLRRGAQVYAGEAWCSHVGGPLIDGAFEGITVECPWRQSCFHLDDGRPWNGPATAPLRTFAVQERDGRISIRPSDEGKTWPLPPASPRAQQPVETTAKKTTVKEKTTMPGFSQDIRPLFRDKDVTSMMDAFDLNSYDSVKAHAEAIYGRVADGTMPCDGAWSADRIALLRAWIDQGCTP
jgi:nitrite reductase/ring-hydroxylating ferredoxin subunit